MQEFKLQELDPAPYRMSLEGARIGRDLGCMSDQYCAFAQEEGMPEDLLLRTEGNREISPSGSTQSINDDDDTLSNNR
jgi:hypothetical protein